MRRRDFIKALGGGAAAWPLAAQAQRIAMPVIGYLAAGNQYSESRLVDAFVKGLREAGYEDGRNTKIEYRWADNQYDRLPSMAAGSGPSRGSLDRSYHNTSRSCRKDSDRCDPHCLHLHR